MRECVRRTVWKHFHFEDGVLPHLLDILSLPSMERECVDDLSNGREFFIKE
jgi:hypothetical protein